MNYIPLNQTIIFEENGATELSVNISIINDTFVECSERFLGHLQLVSPTDPALANRIYIFWDKTIVTIEVDEGHTCECLLASISQLMPLSSVFIVHVLMSCYVV